MKTSFLPLFTLFVVLTSCSEKRAEEVQDIIVPGKITEAENVTYLYAKAKDTVRLDLKTELGKISGTLDVLTFEKDSRRGTITDGYMKGDTLFAVYTSMQEGQKCECEIALLKKDNRFVLSNDIFSETNYQYNDDYTKGWFKDKRKIKFEGSVLQKMPIE